MVHGGPHRKYIQNIASVVPALPDSSLTPRDIIFQYFEKPPFYRDYHQSMPTDLAQEHDRGDRFFLLKELVPRS
jgi:hypothetical protein